MRRGTFARIGALVAVVALLAAACQRGDDAPDATEEEREAQQEQEGLLQQIRDRGTLGCGVNNTVPGFGFETGGGEIEGFDIDFCTAIAAAVFNTPDVEDMIVLTPIDAEERFNALRAGEYDVLVRNTTWTSSRDGSEGVAFAHVNFYDGQAMMVREGEFGAVDEMDGAPVCVTTGTTTELNLADYAAQVGIEVEPVTFAENPQLQEAFIAGRCDGWTSDRSQLAGIRSAWPEDEGGPESLVILDDVMSKEPLAPGVLDGDQEWHQVVDWVVNGLILAEELGVDSGNVDQQAQDPDNPQIAGLLGVAFEAETETISVDSGLGLDNDFMQAVLQAVGNYGEIFDRHLGPNTPIGLDRGVNALWTDGGIQYAMPFR